MRETSIRVGMIRCDLHAAWYACLMEKVDEMTLLKHWPACHYYFYYRNKPKFKIVDGFEIVKLWDPPIRHGEINYPDQPGVSGADLLAKLLGGKPEICDRVEDVSDGVDLVFMSNCLEDGEDHLELARPSLEKGIPTFIDKPLAPTYGDAREIIEIATRSGTPAMNASLLLCNPLIAQFKNRFQEIGLIGEAFIKGVGKSGLNAAIHGLSLAWSLFGDDVEWVDCMGIHDHEILRMHYPPAPDRVPGGVDVIARSGHVMGPNCGFQAIVYGGKGSLVSPWINDYNFPLSGREILGELKKMVATREPPIPYASMLGLSKVVEAGRISRREGGRQVAIKEIS